MKEEGFSVTNTSGEDLDQNQLVFSSEKQDVVTAFEIFEHLLNPPF
jgi:2-polyprenyl-3-methyl-5-hydroxy-6-metoxy-1,4-benzoquinol methylase